MSFRDFSLFSGGAPVGPDIKETRQGGPFLSRNIARVKIMASSRSRSSGVICEGSSQWNIESLSRIIGTMDETLFYYVYTGRDFEVSGAGFDNNGVVNQSLSLSHKTESFAGKRCGISEWEKDCYGRFGK